MPLAAHPSVPMTVPLLHGCGETTGAQATVNLQVDHLPRSAHDRCRSSKYSDGTGRLKLVYRRMTGDKEAVFRRGAALLGSRNSRIASTTRSSSGSVR